jgi:hypothetical protein
VKGFIYILRNNAMPGLLKIGYSVKVPDERAGELYTTGVPEPFEVAYYCLVDDAKKIESNIHNKLLSYRHNNGREFFLVELENVVELIGSLCKPEYERRVEKKVHEISLLSRHNLDWEWQELQNFSQVLYKRGMEKYVLSAFYDSNACLCCFEFSGNVEQFSFIESELFEIAQETISQFEWFGNVYHGKQQPNDSQAEIDDF